uniref:Ferritin n=1 Tax=Glossina palpalis gambiensis TaxID=67801 RepID=A0A1B0B059_9MUSC
MNFLLNPQIRRIFCLMAYHFDRSDVATTGLFNFFKQASLEERHHAELIMEYMNKRGGQIILSSVPEPKASYVSAKEALIEALNMEKEVNEMKMLAHFMNPFRSQLAMQLVLLRSLLDVHATGAKVNDPNLCDFIETHFLQEQNLKVTIEKKYWGVTNAFDSVFPHYLASALLAFICTASAIKNIMH